MLIFLDLILCFSLVILAIYALNSKNLLSSSIILGGYSFVIALVWMAMGAPDVGFTEAVVGAGITTVFFIVSILNTNWVSSD